MRTKDIKKKEAIKSAVIDLCINDGLTNLTTAKVAKVAGVSPATIYLYYQDKLDLLSRLYEEAKDELHQGLTDYLSSAGGDLEQSLRCLMQFSIHQVKKLPQESKFVSLLWMNQELLDQQAVESGRENSKVVTALYDQVQANPEFESIPFATYEALLAIPTQLLQRQPQIDNGQLQQAIDLVIKAIKN